MCTGREVKIFFYTCVPIFCSIEQKKKKTRWYSPTHAYATHPPAALAARFPIQRDGLIWRVQASQRGLEKKILTKVRWRLAHGNVTVGENSSFLFARGV